VKGGPHNPLTRADLCLSTWEFDKSLLHFTEVAPSRSQLGHRPTPEFVLDLDSLRSGHASGTRLDRFLNRELGPVCIDQPGVTLVPIRLAYPVKWTECSERFKRLLLHLF
jgi:hypothetical protein